MKKLLTSLAIISFLFTACEGDRGPQGPEGPPGEDGINVVGQTFEFEDVNFDYFGDDNLYSTVIAVPDEVEVLDSDAILVYRLEVVESDGENVETWSLIPQNFFLDNDRIIQYVYNHTAVDVEILIDGNFDLSDLDTGFTDGQVFRFVVVPSDFAETTNTDVSDFNAVLDALELTENDVHNIQM